MWTIVLLMALGVSVEPTRLGLTVLMLNRPRPLLQLFVFLCGAFVMGLSLGLTLLFVLRVSPMGQADVSGPYIQVALGILALLVAAVLAITAAGGFGWAGPLVNAPVIQKGGFTAAVFACASAVVLRRAALQDPVAR